MKKRTEEGKNDVFIYSCKGTVFINNGKENKRIKKDLSVPEGWVRGRLILSKRG